MNKYSGYTEINLPDGNVVPLKFGMWTMREICKRWNTPLSEIATEIDKRMKDDPFGAFFDIIGPAAEYASGDTGTPEKFTEKQISHWIDVTGGVNSPVLAQVMTTLSAAMGAESTPPAQTPGKPQAPAFGSKVPTPQKVG